MLYQKYIKRIMDAALSLCALLALSPLILFLCLWIALDSPGGVFFQQRRVGRDKTLFSILKFRTMRTDAPHDMPTHLLKDPQAWITRSGGFLRRTSLDELPQLINILKGDMAIVGPRPALWNQNDLIGERDRYGANAIRPGLTGWAQINGRDTLTIQEKARLDGEYTKRVSFWFDCKCIWGTAVCAFSGKGVVEGEADARNDDMRP